MKKILLMPDSFKGTMSSLEICKIMEVSIKKYYPEAEVISIPVADGGEGSVDSFLSAMNGEKIIVTTKNPYMQEIESFYGIVDDGKTAIIEMAASAGLPLIDGNLSAGETTTYGVGELIENAIKRGCKKIVLGLGGSATNDFGTGAAAALGVKFLDKDGAEFIPTGNTLSKIAKIDTSDIMRELKETEIITMCDIDNPLYGKQGAACVFAPQKGANPEQVEYLDKQLRAVSEQVKKDLGIDVSTLPGAGAAGGMGGGMVAFFGSRLEMGIQTVLDTVKFDQLLEGADLVISGEGKIDSQSLRGKVVIGVANRTKKKNIPLIAVVGDIGDNIEEAYEKGVTGIFSINRVAIPYSEAKLRSKSDLALTMNNILFFTKSMGI